MIYFFNNNNNFWFEFVSSVKEGFKIFFLQAFMD